jgi:trans-aconitate 2-methyltransferase
VPSWDASQYSVFLDDRTRPARDLLARVDVDAPRRVLDVGCGPGNSTALLRARWPGAEIVGLDSSPEMLAKARQELPDVEFVEADLRDWVPPAPFDVVYSNATLHWVEDHPTTFQRLWEWVAAGGTLAVQMPANFDQPSHRLMRELAASPLWADELEGVLSEEPVASPQTYHRLLSGPGRRVDIWTTEYLQVLTGEDPVLEWVRGSALRPVLDALSDEEAEEFVAAYAASLAEAYPPEDDGSTLFPFRRIFIVVSAR